MLKVERSYHARIVAAWRKLLGDRRQHTCVALEELCELYGGLGKISLMVAWHRLDSQDWQVFYCRHLEDVGDRMTDTREIEVDLSDWPYRRVWEVL